MKFSKREDIEAPVAAVYAAISNFAAMERAALRRGIEVSRLDATAEAGPGSRWAIRAPIRGKSRDIRCELLALEVDAGLAARAQSGGITGHVTVDLVALSRMRTRLQVGVDLRAGTLPARLILQSMKFAKPALDRRFARRVAEFAARIEAQHRRPGDIAVHARR